MKTSAMAIVGLVIGIIALVTSFIPIVNNISAIMALVGLVFAIVGIVSTRKPEKSGRGIAVAGLIACVLAFIIVLVTQSLFSSAIDEALSPTPAASSSESSTTQASDAQAEPQDTTAQYAYAVTIDSCEQTTNYEGKPAVAITYTFTNNSDKDISFMVAISDKCFQNGVQLEKAYITGIDSSRATSDIKPGSSITVQQAYMLDDQSDVTVECTQLISLSDDILATQTFSLAS